MGPDTMYFQGSVPQAIEHARMGNLALVVLLVEPDTPDTAAYDGALNASSDIYLSRSVLLRLEDDLGNSDADKFIDAKCFRAFCPVLQLPALVALTPQGGTLLKIEGPLPPSDGLQQLFIKLRNFYAFLQVMNQYTHEVAAGNGIEAPSMPNTNTNTNAPEDEDPHRISHTQTAAQDSVVLQSAAAGINQPAYSENNTNRVPSGPLEASDERENEEERDGNEALPLLEPVVEPVTLHLRFPDGTNIQHTFEQQALISDVFAAVDESRADTPGGDVPYVLVSNQPRGQFGAEVENKRICDVGFYGRTLVSVVPHPKGHTPPARPQAHTQTVAVAATSPETIAEGKVDVDLTMEDADALKESLEELTPASKKPKQTTLESPSMPLHATYMLQLKFYNSDALKAEFEVDATLGDVSRYIDEHRTDGGGAYTLVNPFPRKSYSNADMGSTLQELGLGHRATLLVQLINQSREKDNYQQQDSGVLGSLVGTLASTLKSYINPWSYFSSAPAENPTAAGGVPGVDAGQDFAVEQSAGARDANVPSPAEKVRRRGAGGNVRSLADVNNGSDTPNDDHNSYWNGNSTQFDGGDDKNA